MDFFTYEFVFIAELIDTLWNVNVYHHVEHIRFLLELIDTLWNVNTKTVTPGTSSIGINRYIMECKCQESADFRRLGDELIDTLWNVNMFSEIHHAFITSN